MAPDRRELLQAIYESASFYLRSFFVRNHQNQGGKVWNMPLCWGPSDAAKRIQSSALFGVVG